MPPQHYALGIKEVWQVPGAGEEGSKHKPGMIQHTMNWPIGHTNYGGSFLYHMAPDKILLGYVVGLGYANPYLSP